MTPAANKTFSSADHMIPENVGENSGQNFAYATTITALQNFRTAHEANAGEKTK